MNEDRIADVIIITAVISVIVLKCTGVITISWLWILAPFWILMGLGVGIVFLIVAVQLIRDLINRRNKDE